MAYPGANIAIGAPHASKNTYVSGHVRVMKFEFCENSKATKTVSLIANPIKLF